MGRIEVRRGTLCPGLLDLVFAVMFAVPMWIARKVLGGGIAAAILRRDGVALGDQKLAFQARAGRL
jgi:hypothetical protein